MAIPFDAKLPDLLRERLHEPLPGREAQSAYSHELSYGRHLGPPLDRSRKAAVLVLLRWDGAQWLLPLTRRQQGLGIHSGQICCAGGGINSNETAVDAALRECQEEIGWAPAKTDVLGHLSPMYVYASNNFVSSVVAATAAEPKWVLDSREVAELIELPLKHLCFDDVEHDTTIVRHGIRTRARCFRWQSYEIWGATSMILAELKSVLRNRQ